VPFIIILSISALKEIFEDLVWHFVVWFFKLMALQKRRNADSRVNNFGVHIFHGTSWTHSIWRNVSAECKNNSLFPQSMHGYCSGLRGGCGESG
jgi:hypothetical protein